MKKAISFTIVFFVLATAWYLFLEIGDRKFKENLPELPAVEHPEEPTSENEQTDIVDFGGVETPLSVDREGEQRDIEEASTNKTDDQPLTPETSQPHPAETDPMPEGPSEPQPGDVAEGVFQMNLTDISREELINRNREHLMKIHGDIPEIDIFLDRFPLFSAIQQGKTQVEVSQTYTQEEDLAFKRALAVLFPNEVNKRKYEEALREMQQNQNE